MKKHLKLLFICSSIINGQYIAAQVHKVFLSDNKDSVYRTIVQDNVFGIMNHFEFKERLPAGKWIMFGMGLAKKDSSNKNANDYVEAIGYFNQDSLKNGNFYYDYPHFISKKKKDRYFPPIKYNSRFQGVYNGMIGEYYPTTIYHYKNGKLDGTQVSKYEDGNVKEIVNYNNGRRDGLRVVQDQPGFPPNRMELYKNDSLVSWWMYYANGILGSKGQGDYNKLNGINEIYDTLGNIYYSATYLQGSLKNYCFYNVYGKHREEAQGDFEYSNPGGDYLKINKSMPTNGKVKYYNEDGTLKKEETYKNGKLVDSN